jgi:hypothetical protein
MEQKSPNCSQPYATVVLGAARDCGTLRTALRCLQRIFDSLIISQAELEQIQIRSAMRIARKFHRVSTILHEAFTSKPLAWESPASLPAPWLTSMASLDQLEAAEELLHIEVARVTGRR